MSPLVIDNFRGHSMDAPRACANLALASPLRSGDLAMTAMPNGVPGGGLSRGAGSIA